MRTIFAVLSDTHAGFKLALMNPEVILYDEDEFGDQIPYTPEPTASQNYLWALYEQNLNELQDFAGEDDIHVLHNGDLTHGVKHPSLLVSNRSSDQVLIGAANLERLLDIPNVKSLNLAVGTEAHNFGQGSSEFLVREILVNKFPNTAVNIAYHGLLDVQGVTIDYAHHGPYPGSREWLKGNVARFYLKDLMMRDIINGCVPPQLVFRGHYHNRLKVSEDVGEYTSTLILTPSYSMLSDYDHKAVKSPDRITHGMTMVEIIDGRVKDIISLGKTIDIRTRRKLI